MKKLTNTIILTTTGIDLLFGSLVAFALPQLFGAAHRGSAALVVLGLLLTKVVFQALVVSGRLRPYEAFAAARSDEQRDALVAEADARLQGFPGAFSGTYVATWLLMIGGAHFVWAVVNPEYYALLPGSNLALAFVFSAVLFGAFAVVFPVMILLTADAAGRCSIYARQRGVLLNRFPIKLQWRLTAVTLAVALGPLSWMVAVGYMGQVTALAGQAATVGDAAMRAGRVATVGGEGGFLMAAGVFGLLVVLWAPLCAFALSRAVSEPLERLTRTAREIVEEGNQTRMGTLPVNRDDEVGQLAHQFNDLLDLMRELSRGANSIAEGQLTVVFNRPGELPDAFRRMVESLGGMVNQIRQTAVDLAAAATEILAASQEQESAATSQSSSMTEISHTMDSLSASAAHVSESVAGVLANAEQTLVTTDNMVERIESLSNHTGRISELLDVIRDIADKSDLLALNGSLEASRAGEGGQGFALVAAEMRRLAVRVTASVEDVKKLVSDIRESSTSTIMATEESRRLARGTTDAARQITLVTQQQRSGTEQVSQSVREITDVVTQAAAATSQTRTSAQGLKQQADALSELVRRFQLIEAAR